MYLLCMFFRTNAADTRQAKTIDFLYFFFYIYSLQKTFAFHKMCIVFICRYIVYVYGERPKINRRKKSVFIYDFMAKKSTLIFDICIFGLKVLRCNIKHIRLFIHILLRKTHSISGTYSEACHSSVIHFWVLFSQPFNLMDWHTE